MVSPDKGLPVAIDPGKPKDDGTIDLATVSKNVKWVAKLGTQTYGNPTVSGGKVFLGTNNGWPHYREDLTGDYGVLLALDQATGKRAWTLFSPKLAAGKVSDWEQVGLCSSPTIDGDRVYVVTNRCEVLCLDANGMKDGNKGPFQDEGQYIAGPGGSPVKVGPGDADILWRYDLRDELGVFPHNMTSSSVLVVGDKLFVTTSNAVDWTDKHIPNPDAPALICLDKKTGKLLGQERSGICSRIFLSNWSSPAYGVVAGKPIVVFGAGDGFCYAFDPEPMKSGDGPGTLREIWRCDCNPPERRMKDGKPRKHSEAEGPSEIIATPVVYQDRVYVGIGQEPENGDGVGCFNCIDATKTGDISTSGKLWTNDKIGRTLSTASISDGLVYVSDFPGILHCFDADTGKQYWTHDTEAHIWGSTLLADGKVYLANENGALTILAAGKEKKVLATIDFKDPIYATPIVADGILYIGTGTNLYAIAGAAH
ncbi:MAG TPA: PQQ-binding-like beta-propeller repeat protein [Tepidisphaeraceae bacterium]|nr:PQQ-binding-like beta-propeller repeat protein [Tepidisphaeraceae bacterium]